LVWHINTVYLPKREKYQCKLNFVPRMNVTSREMEKEKNRRESFEQTIGFPVCTGTIKQTAVTSLLLSDKCQ
jgi:hypothetical protein